MVLTYLGGLLGARLLFVVENAGHLPGNWAAVFSPSVGGSASMGGVLLGALCCVVATRALGLALLPLADSFGPGLCLFAVAGRVGCFMAGCCHGRPTGLPWGVVFPPGSPAAARFGEGVPVHPTQLYEAGLLLVLLLVLLKLDRLPSWPGRTFFLLLLAYTSTRFVLEFTRGDHVHSFLELPLAQWLSGALALAAALGLRVGRHSAEHPDATGVS
jgi:phosphatidylglycerol:prolipoprotein diacylglycerol transferase